MHTRNTLAIAILCGLAPPALGAFEGFAPRVDYPLATGYRPADTVVADFNNDGALDIACPILNADRVAVLLNNGDGTFGTAAYFGVGDDPVAIAAADINFDGAIDLLTANRTGDSFTVLRGTGSGTFTFGGSWATGDRPQDLVVADLNSDGRPDVAVCNDGPDTVGVYFGNGGGGFTLDATYTTNNPDGNFGNGPRAITAADLNANGQPDILTANYSSDTVTVLFAIPGVPGAFYSGEFGIFVEVGDGPFDLMTADLGLDGDIDLVTCDGVSGTVTNRFSDFAQGGGPFPDFGGGISLHVGGRPIGMHSADFDDAEADGDPDILISDEINNHLILLQNGGNGFYSVVGEWDAGSSAQDPAAADLDGDGDVDVVVPQLNGAAVGIFLNTSTVVGGPHPVVRIDEPGDYGASGGCVCGPMMTVSGIATIPAGGIFDHYSLQYRRSNVATWTTIKESTNPVGEPGNDLGIWNLTGQPEGFYVLRLTATSASGLSARDEAVVWVSQNYNTVDFHFASGYDDGSTGVAGRNICVYGFVNDDACGANTYTVDYRPTSGGPWDPVDPGIPVYSGDRLNTEIARWNTVALGVPDGDYSVRVIAENGCGQTRSLTRTVTVDNTAPLAEITGPSNCIWIDPVGTIPVKGTAFDANLSTWVLEFTGGPFTSWVPIVPSGGTNVVDNVLADWDVSSLPPCAYTLRLRVYDKSRLGCGTSTWRTDALVTVNVGCRADLAEPYGVLDLSDINTFVSEFVGGCP